MAFSRNFFLKVAVNFHDQYLFTFRNLKTSLNTRSISWIRPEDASNKTTFSFRKPIETSSSSRRFLAYFNDQNKTSDTGTAFEQRAAFTETRKSFLTTRRMKIATPASRNFSNDFSNNDEAELSKLIDEVKQFVKTDSEKFSKKYQINMKFNAVCETVIAECEKLLPEHEKATEQNQILKETVQVLNEMDEFEGVENDSRIAGEVSPDTHLCRRLSDITQAGVDQLKCFKEIWKSFGEAAIELMQLSRSKENAHKVKKISEMFLKLIPLARETLELKRENQILDNKIRLWRGGALDELDQAPAKCRLQLIQECLYVQKNFNNIKFKDPTQREEEK